MVQVSNGMKALLAIPLFLALGVAPACGIPTPRAAQIAEAGIHTAFRAAELVVTHLRSQDLNSEQTKRLERAQKLLDMAADYLTDLTDEHARTSCKSNVGDALEALTITVEELESQGVEIPTEVAKSLDLASALAK